MLVKCMFLLYFLISVVLSAVIRSQVAIRGGEDICNAVATMQSARQGRLKSTQQLAC